MSRINILWQLAQPRWAYVSPNPSFIPRCLVVPKQFFVIKILFLCCWVSNLFLYQFWCQNFHIFYYDKTHQIEGLVKKKKLIASFKCSSLFMYICGCVLLAKVPFGRCVDKISLVLSPFAWYVRWLYLETIGTLVRNYVFKARCLYFFSLSGLCGRKHFVCFVLGCVLLAKLLFDCHTDTINLILFLFN